MKFAVNRTEDCTHRSKNVLKKKNLSENRMKKNVFLLIVGLLGAALQVNAQDPQFSQFYAAPIYHNPAFAGGAYAPRLIVNYRNQWPSLNANFVTSAVSVDHYFDRINSGVAVLLLSDSQGNGLVKNTEIAAQYSYQVQLNDENFLRLGVQGAYSSRGLDVYGLTFGDQYNNSGYILGSNSADPMAILSNYRPVQIPDFAAGALFYNPKLWVGFSSHHLTAPQLDFLITTPVNAVGSPVTLARNGRLPRKYMLTGGVNIPLGNPNGLGSNMGREITATPTFLLKRQGNFTQLDLGAYLTYSPLTLGLWYRGIPVSQYGLNQDALVGLVGFRLDNISFGYSYDLTVSSLGFSTGGSHEISLAYHFNPIETSRPPYNKRRKKELSCPKF